MSTSSSSSQSSSRPDGTSDLVRAARPLTATETARIEEEARQRAGESGQEIMGESRRGRVEAETHRVSEEMTRRAQDEQRRSAAEHAAPTPVEGAAKAQAPVGRVVLPVSGAAFAERAIPYGVAVARLAGAPLALVHIGDLPHEEPTPALERVVAALGADAGLAAPPAAGVQSLGTGSLWEQVARHLVGVEWLALPNGSVTQGLLSLEAPDGSDLVILATQRHTGAEGDTLGAVSHTLIRQGHAPVLVISPQVAVPAHGLPRLSRILVPLDGSALAEEALAPVMVLASSLASGRADVALEPSAREGIQEIVLFSVVETPYAVDDAYRYVNDTAEALRSTLPAAVAVSAEVHVGSAPGAIVAAASGGEASREHPTPFDLVAMATHGRGGMRRWLLGSVAEYVLTHATVPVLVTRPARVEE